MASLEYTTLDVFTTTKYLGNPLAIVHLPAGAQLTKSQKQTIAHEFNYSETIFLHLPPISTPSGPPTWPVEIFTPDQELPFAGHPTIGAATHILRSLALSFPSAVVDGHIRGAFECAAGRLDLVYAPASGEARAGVPHAVRVHAEEAVSVAQVLGWQGGLEEGEVRGVRLVSAVRGMNFVMVEVEGLEALGKVRTVGARIEGPVLDQGWDVGPTFVMFYVRMRGEEDEEEGQGEVVKLRTRMIEGLVEDPATGSASLALAALISLAEGREGKTKYEMVQAVEMGRRSEIGVEVAVEGGEVKTAVLIGKAVTVMQGRLFYE